MPSVLILSSTYKPNIGGIENFLESFIKLLTRNGNFAYLLTFKQETYSKFLRVKKLPSKSFERGKNYEIHRIGFFDFWLNTLFDNHFLRDLFSFLNMIFYGMLFLLKNSDKVSIIHANDPPQAAVAFVLAKLFNKRCVVSLHNIYKLSGRGLRGIFGKFILDRIDAIFAISNQIIKQLSKDGVRSNVYLSRYWIDTKLFKPKNRKICRTKLKLPPNEFYALFVGRITESKGTMQLVEASKSSNGVKFLVVGSGDLEDYVKNNESENLLFLGPKPEKQLPDCYNAANISVFPTTYSYEGFGRVIMESLACGTPVLISNKMPIEAISNKVGRVINPKPKDIANSVKSVNRYFKKNIRSICRKFAIDNYSESNADVILNVYKTLTPK